VFADYLAMCGATIDGSLIGSTINRQYPFIAMASVAIPDKYYWAKVFSSKAYKNFRGV
jgi:hypothetical protein